MMLANFIINASIDIYKLYAFMNRVNKLCIMNRVSNCSI